MEERRSHTRYPARWAVQILCPCQKTGEHTLIKAKTQDVSTGGLCILSKHNICGTRTFSLEIYVPPLITGGEHITLAYDARTTYTVYDNRLLGFRTGITFTRIERATMEFLRGHLMQRFGSNPVLACSAG